MINFTFESNQTSETKYYLVTVQPLSNSDDTILASMREVNLGLNSDDETLATKQCSACHSTNITGNSKVCFSCLTQLKSHTKHCKSTHRLGMCTVCYGRPCNSVFVPCGHISMCILCATKDDNSRCPICRTRGNSYKIYLST